MTMLSSVKYELNELETLFSLINSEKRSKVFQAEKFENAIHAEVTRIKQTFINEVFTFEDERHLERYIQYHQQALIQLMDKSTKGTARSSAHRSKANFLNYHKCLENLLSFIEQHFTKYFNQDAKAPESYIAVVKEDAQRNYQELKNDLEEKKVSPELLAVVLYALRTIMEKESNEDFTYRRIIYAKAIQKELFRLLKNGRAGGDINEEVRMMMYYMNYNSVRGFTYFSEYIDEIIKKAESQADQIERLSFLLKRINQAQVKPGIAYNANAPSIRDQVNSYILEEMDHLRRIQQVAAGPALKPIEKEDSKIKFDLSVAQLALLIKVFIETKILITDNIADVQRLLSKIIISKRAEKFTFESLRTKYYDVESTTKDAVKLILQKVITHIDRNYY